MRHENVVIQTWDLSCGAAALATLLRYEFGDNVSEKEVAHGLMRRSEYIEHPEIVQVREGFSLLDLKRYVQTHGYKGVGLGKLELQDLIEHAPIMVPVDALGYNHFVVFRGIKGNRVLLADPAWGNRTMTIEKFQRMWLNYGVSDGPRRLCRRARRWAPDHQRHKAVHLQRKHMIEWQCGDEDLTIRFDCGREPRINLTQISHHVAMVSIAPLARRLFPRRTEKGDIVRRDWRVVKALLDPKASA